MKLKSITPITKGNGYIFKVIFERDKADSLEVTVTAGQLLNYRSFRIAVLSITGQLYFNPHADRQTREKVEAAWCEELDCLLAQNK